MAPPCARLPAPRREEGGTPRGPPPPAGRAAPRTPGTTEPCRRQANQMKARCGGKPRTGAPQSAQQNDDRAAPAPRWPRAPAAGAAGLGRDADARESLEQSRLPAPGFGLFGLAFGGSALLALETPEAVSMAGVLGWEVAPVAPLGVRLHVLRLVLAWVSALLHLLPRRRRRQERPHTSSSQAATTITSHAAVSRNSRRVRSLSICGLAWRGPLSARWARGAGGP